MGVGDSHCLRSHCKRTAPGFTCQEPGATIQPTNASCTGSKGGTEWPFLHFQGPPPCCTLAAKAICWAQSQREGAARGQLCISPHVFCRPSIHHTFCIQSSVAAALPVAGGYLKQEVSVWFQVVPLCAAEAVWNHCKCVKSPSAHTNSGPFFPHSVGLQKYR